MSADHGRHTRPGAVPRGCLDSSAAPSALWSWLHQRQRGCWKAEPAAGLVDRCVGCFFGEAAPSSEGRGDAGRGGHDAVPFWAASLVAGSVRSGRRSSWSYAAIDGNGPCVGRQTGDYRGWIRETALSKTDNPSLGATSLFNTMTVQTGPTQGFMPAGLDRDDISSDRSDGERCGNPCNDVLGCH